MNDFNPQNDDEHVPPESVRTEEFVRLFSGCQRELFKFIFLLIPNYSDAENVLQETSVILWRKFGDFQSGTDFFRWAAQVARNKARDFRKGAARDRHCFWSDDLMESIADTRLDDEPAIERQRSLLARCIRWLAASDRELVRQCFGSKQTIKAAAERIGRPVNTVYKSLNRIRKILMDCVEKSQRQGDREG